LARPSLADDATVQRNAVDDAEERLSYGLIDRAITDTGVNGVFGMFSNLNATG
jgi:hypothetical protein